MLNARRVEEEEWLAPEDGRLVVDPRAARSPPHLPRIIGHWHPRGQVGRRPVYGSSGPSPTPRVDESGVLEP
eukprot:5541048-Pyramimonas_sp.AAC.1